MAKIDVSSMRIRVILNGNYYNEPSSNYPLDMEGTVLFVMTHTNLASNMINKGQILELLCDPDIDPGEADIKVRWDNDRRTYIQAGSLIFRSGIVSRCKSIWDDNDDGFRVLTDNRPREALKSDTGGYSVLPQKETLKWIKGSKGNLKVAYNEILNTMNSMVTTRGQENLFLNTTVSLDVNPYTEAFRGIVSEILPKISTISSPPDNW